MVNLCSYLFYHSISNASCYSAAYHTLDYYPSKPCVIISISLLLLLYYCMQWYIVSIFGALERHGLLSPL